ncbi:RdgB/HAM1 family non-canonical purine NTP pyrophosphatase [Spiroplasma chrysopicola]|uniref:dITP/XTP pyrophosphatase n=1 Tax=Spiroplasma chrysopicola DF-1 TaxID=1276227 RepID=R4UI33_9MOLU|nr:RdgB/HAM1 family non-canonical purine NTP pyrophosphatase [Spiroplasma chrysopicola]AGM24976.1 dITP/XTP pyrophosphatase [Spiroplasma chrysopicola DF-1]
MHEIWIATNNKNKVWEFTAIFAEMNVTVKSLLDLPTKIDIPEEGTSFFENAYQKAAYLAHKINKPVLADDSGLEIIGLNNFPGIFTKRWALPITDNNLINQMLIDKCENLVDRSAQAVCTLVYFNPLNGKKGSFTGITKGEITLIPIGENNFGYDPIFKVQELNKTYAQLTLTEKNHYSHRAKAVNQFKEWWKKEEEGWQVPKD